MFVSISETDVGRREEQEKELLVCQLKVTTVMICIYSQRLESPSLFSSSHPSRNDFARG